MNEYNEFLQDYKDCLDRIDNFENYNYIETELWVVKKYADWIKKDKRYELSLTCCTNKPLDDVKVQLHFLELLYFLFSTSSNLSFKR